MYEICPQKGGVVRLPRPPISYAPDLYIQLLHFYVFRQSNPVTLKKSYLSTYLRYVQNSFSIQEFMTCPQIIIFIK